MQPGRQVEVREVQVDPAQARVDEPVPVADLLGVGVQDALQVQLPGHGHGDPGPVVEQVGVPDEDAAPVGDAVAGGQLGVQQHVQPGRGEVGGAEPVAVVPLLAAHDLGGWAQHRREDRHGPRADRGDPPQAQEPAQPRVLDHQLGMLDQMVLEPLRRADPLGLPGGDPARLEPGRGPAVVDGDDRVHEQAFMVVDEPLGLGEPLGVRLVRRHLRLGHVQAQQLHDPGHGAGAAAPCAGDEEHLARVAGGRRVAHERRAYRGPTLGP